jgi:hypothetical protein
MIPAGALFRDSNASFLEAFACNLGNSISTTSVAELMTVMLAIEHAGWLHL